MSEPELREERAQVRREEVERVETKPFLLLSIRAEKEAAENEYESFLRFSGLEEAERDNDNTARSSARH